MAGYRLTVRDDRDPSSYPNVPLRLGLTSLGINQQNNICGMQGIAVQSACNMRTQTTAQVISIYVGASKCFRNHFISAKYKPEQSFKLQFLQNSPLAHLHTSASDCKGVENIHGSHFVKAFSALPSHS